MLGLGVVAVARLPVFSSTYKPLFFLIIHGQGTNKKEPKPKLSIVYDLIVTLLSKFFHDFQSQAQEL